MPLGRQALWLQLQPNRRTGGVRARVAGLLMLDPSQTRPAVQLAAGSPPSVAATMLSGPALQVPAEHHACPSSAGRKFQVSGGIPNLLLQEDEC